MFVCLLKMGLKNVSPWNLRGASSAVQGFGKTVRVGAAVAALQEKWLTDINGIFGTAGIFSRGAAVATCTAAFLTRGGTGGKRKN